MLSRLFVLSLGVSRRLYSCFLVSALWLGSYHGLFFFCYFLFIFSLPIFPVGVNLRDPVPIHPMGLCD